MELTELIPDDILMSISDIQATRKDTRDSYKTDTQENTRRRDWNRMNMRLRGIELSRQLRMNMESRNDV